MVEGAHTYAEHAYARYVRKCEEMGIVVDYQEYDELPAEQKELWLAVGEFIREQVEEASREGRE